MKSVRQRRRRRLGVGQEKRISSPHSRLMAPSRASSLKKHGENRRKSGGEWRPFRLPKAPFRRPSSRLYSVATLVYARPYDCSGRLSRAAFWPPDRHLGADFRAPRHETTYVGQGRFDGWVDFVARLGAPRVPQGGAFPRGVPGSPGRLTCGAPAGHGDGNSATSSFRRSVRVRWPQGCRTRQPRAAGLAFRDDRRTTPMVDQNK
jgi:hypothetical protein